MNRTPDTTIYPAEFDLSFLDLQEWQPKPLPPMQRPAKRVVALVENKLVGIDMLLPVMMELKAENPNLDIEFLFIRRAFLDAVRSNYVLWEGIRRTGKVSVLIDAGFEPATLLERVKSIYNLTRQVFKAAKRTTAVFYRQSFHRFPIWPIAMAVKWGNGALFGYPGLPYPSSAAFVKHRFDAFPRTRINSAHHFMQNDLHLLFHPLQEIAEKRKTNSPMQVIGTSRQFPAWKSFLDEIERERGIVDVDGRQIEIRTGANILIFYGGSHSIPHLRYPTASKDQLLCSLKAISAVASNARVIIKPHPNCNMAELIQDLEPYRDLEVRVTFAHPQILAKHASVSFFGYGSSVMDDMYVNKVPVIDAALYTFENGKVGGGHYPNKGRLACPTQPEIERALAAILRDTSDAVSPETDHLFWPKPSRISDLLWGVSSEPVGSE